MCSQLGLGRDGRKGAWLRQLVHSSRQLVAQSLEVLGGQKPSHLGEENGSLLGHVRFDRGAQANQGGLEPHVVLVEVEQL